jgi:hypothetical protein
LGHRKSTQVIEKVYFKHTEYRLGLEEDKALILDMEKHNAPPNLLLPIEVVVRNLSVHEWVMNLHP